MALSKTTTHGLGYYDASDVTSWLNGFNVDILKLEEILTTMDSTNTGTKEELQTQITSIKADIKKINDAMVVDESNITSLQTALTNVNVSITNLSKSITSLDKKKSNTLFVKSFNSAEKNVAALNALDFTINAELSGYTPLAVVGFDINRAISISKAILRGSTIYMTIFNDANMQLNDVVCSCDVLYVKNI